MYGNPITEYLESDGRGAGNTGPLFFRPLHRARFKDDPAIIEEDASGGTEAKAALESVKHDRWHGNVDATFERVTGLLFKLEMRGSRSTAIAKLSRSITEFETYIRNNRGVIPNIGKQHRHGDIIRTAFTESTINQVVSKHFVRTQQMQWTPEGAHLLLQTRTRVFNGDLDAAFRDWYPQFRQAAA